MIRKFLIALLCIVAQDGIAQNGTLSPYSFFGIGDLRDDGTVENQMMGGLGTYGDSIHVNLHNPAAYSKLRRTTYTGALSHSEYRLEDAAESQNASVTRLEYLALGFPIAQNAGIGFGITSFSSVGYDLFDETTEPDENDITNSITITNTFTGEGGLSRVYLSAGFEPFKYLSFGATANFYFGTLEHQRIQSQEGVQFSTLERLESRVNGLNVTGAITYTPLIKEKYTLYTSVVVNTQANLTSKNTKQLGAFLPGSDVEDVPEVDLDAVNLRNTTYTLPTQITLGLGFGENKKWFLGGEYSFQSSSASLNDFLERENVTYNSASSYAFGGYIVPDYRPLSSYFKRITYRAGLRYEVTGLEVNNEAINDFGITFGVGLPLGKNLSNLNVGFEVGQRGTTEAGLVEENYLKVNIGLSLNDLWFMKRKID